MDRTELKQKICAAIDQHREEIIALGEDIFRHPEMGYKETRTATKVCEEFDKLGFSYQSGLALTGVMAKLKGGESKVNVAVMGELDAIIAPQQEFADPVTGAPLLRPQCSDRRHGGGGLRPKIQRRIARTLRRCHPHRHPR